MQANKINEFGDHIEITINHSGSISKKLDKNVTE